MEETPETIPSQEGTSVEQPQATSIAEATRNFESSMKSESPRGQTQEVAQKVQELADLDKLEKFLWKGKEVTRKELEDGYLRQQDYTKKTQEFSKEKKFYENLSYDLEKVKNNPDLKDQFLKIYPKSFHRFLDDLQGKSEQKPEAVNNDVESLVQNLLNREIAPLKEYLTSIEAKERAAQVSAFESKLESYTEKFSKKYPLADESLVLDAALHMIEKQNQEATESGEQSKPDLNEAQLEKIWKHMHDQTEKRFNNYYKDKFSRQKKLNEEGADTAPGGVGPGRDSQIKSLKEAKDYLYSQYQG